MGGFDVRLYASLYRDQIAGMVLVDASHPDQENRFPPELKNMEGTWLREAEFLEYTMPFGVPRLLGLCENDPVPRAAECNFHSARENVAELKAVSESAAETAATGSLGDMPLAVLSHDPEKAVQRISSRPCQDPSTKPGKRCRKNWLHLSTRGTQAIAQNSSHYIQTRSARTL